MAKLKSKHTNDIGVDAIDVAMCWPCVPPSWADVYLRMLPAGPIREKERARWQAWVDRGRPDPHVLYQEEQQREAERVQACRLRGQQAEAARLAAEKAKAAAKEQEP